jgi:hypothetical protein
MKTILQYILVIVLLTSASCGNKGNKTIHNERAVSNPDDSRMMAKHVRKYGMKSGIITFSVETNFVQEKQVKKVYFDDFGARETSEKYRNDKLIEKLINKADGYVYQLAIERKSGIRSKHAMATGTEMKFDVSDGSWSEDLKKQYNFARLPNENICGKDCELFSTENEKMKAKYAGWNGILLMIEISSPVGNTNMTTKSVATRIEENAVIPETVWEVPAGISIIEK